MEQSLKLQGEGNYLEITPSTYFYLPETDSYDRSWLTTNVKVKGGAFCGEYDANLQTFDFIYLKQQLEALYRDLSSSFEFSPLEGQLFMRFSGDGLGHIYVDCTAKDQPGGGSTLNFEINIDQTDIQELINQLNAITVAYPVE